LVGDEAFVRPLLDRAGDLPVVHAPQTVTMADAATAPLRRKSQSSIRIALEELKAGRAVAVVSAGHSGAAMASALHVLGRLPGVSRPALVTVVPRADGGETVLLDLGANVDCKVEHLVQFALMGNAYSQVVLGVKRPRVGLLSNGEERSKGNAQVRAALGPLDELDLDFIGPVEPDAALLGAADVLVCDGFVGNVMLKTVEATAKVVTALLRRELTSWRPGSRLGLWMLAKPFRSFRQRTAASNYGGALLLGVDGVVVVCHGGSDAAAISAAVEVARRCVVEDVVGRVAAAIQRQGGPRSSRNTRLAPGR
jgi:glycerol-3-phosphate acyltransferase PlsX